MNGSNAAVLDAKVLQNDLDNRSEAIGCARRVGDNRLIDKFVVVASENHVQSALFFHRRRYDNLFDTSINIGLQGGYRQELSRAFHDEINACQVDIANALVLGEFD